MARMGVPDRTPRATAADVPGYRRLIWIVPRAGEVLALLEDDIHSLAVRLRHDGLRVTAIETEIDRLPWNTCPGAAAVLASTFTGVPLAEVSARKDRKANCTHMHDMAVIAAAHAADVADTRFDVIASDPVDGRRTLELWRDGPLQLRWEEQDGVLTSPPPIAGRTLTSLRDWIGGLAARDAEAARILQWGAIVAHGRTIPFAQQSDPALMLPHCYTFQPQVARRAQRIGAIKDFSSGEHIVGDTLYRRLKLAS